MVYTEVNIRCQTRHIYGHLKFIMLLQPKIIIDLFDFSTNLWNEADTHKYACHDTSSEQRNHRGLFFAPKVLIL